MAVLDVGVPHFSFPFNFESYKGALRAGEVEQDTVLDVEYCVAAALLTRQGERVTNPDFGVTDPTFELEPVDVDTLVAEAQRNEPRAHIIMIEAPDAYDPLIERIQAFVSLREEKSGA